MSSQSSTKSERGMQDFYQVLHLSYEEKPTQRDIKLQYLKLAQKYHPDRVQHKDNNDEFLSIQQAYELLRDVKKRRAYDQELERMRYEMNKFTVGQISEFVNLSEMELKEELKCFVKPCRCSSAYKLELSEITNRETEDIDFESIVVPCNGCSLKIKVINDLDEESEEERDSES
jgi:DnaJ-class molecular chaperone